MNAIGIVSKAGRYGGTYAHSDIAMSFATWISPEFQLYIIKDYRRLKFLLELGTGFAFVGREYRLVIGNTEKFIDLHFYNINLHCYSIKVCKILLKL